MFNTFNYQFIDLNDRDKIYIIDLYQFLLFSQNRFNVWRKSVKIDILYDVFMRHTWCVPNYTLIWFI